MILLSFDIEEFDMPFEYGVDIPFEKQLEVSADGTLAILKILDEQGVKATFYCTANFAVNRPEIIRQIVDKGHEVASHGYFHSDFEIKHLEESKNTLEEITGTTVNGYRMARMMPVSEQEIARAGYKYNSSINPTFLPGRYNNFGKPRTYFYDGGVLQLPASVSPIVRFPLFWLSFHNLPLCIYRSLCKRAINKDKYLNIYFHPWEFQKIDTYKFPFYVTRNTGEKMTERLTRFICWAKTKGYSFVTTSQFIEKIVIQKYGKEKNTK